MHFYVFWDGFWNECNMVLFTFTSYSRKQIQSRGSLCDSALNDKGENVKLNNARYIEKNVSTAAQYNQI